MSTIKKRLDRIEEILKARKGHRDYSYLEEMSEEELKNHAKKLEKQIEKDPKHRKDRERLNKMSHEDLLNYADKYLRRVKQSRLG